MKLKLATNTLFQIIGKIISSGASFIITILLARTYGPQGYGDFEKITAFVSLFYLMVDFGFNAIVINKIKKQEDSRENLYGLVFGSRIILGILIIFVCLAILPFLPGAGSQGYTPFVKLGIILVSTTIFFQGLSLTNNLLFQESLRYDKSILASSVGYLIFLGLIYLVTVNDLPLIFTLISFIVFYLVNILVSFYLVRTLVGRFSPIFNFSKIFNLFKETLPFGITLVFNVIYFRSDIVILSALKSTQDVAFYGLAYRFFEFALVFPTFFNNALYPILLDARQMRTPLPEGRGNFKVQSETPHRKPQNEIRSKFDQEGLSGAGVSFEKTKNYFLLSSGFLFGIGLVACLFFLLLAPYLINLTSSSFNESILSLRILSLSLPIFYLTSLFMWFLITYDKQKLLAPIYGITMIINIVLNIIFIPRFSYLASSAITGITELIIFLATGYFVLKLFREKQLNNKTTK